MKTKCFRFYTSLLFVLVLSAMVVADDAPEPPVGSLPADTVQAVEVDPLPTLDTILYTPESEIPLAARVTNPANLERNLTQQPTVALFKSVLVPGWGQLGNRRYTKALVVAGVESWLIGMAVHRHSQATDARDIYLATDDTTERYLRYSEYDQVRKSRNKYAWFAGLTIFLSMFDAYVDAHLSGSPADSRNDNLQVEVVPDTEGGLAALVSYNF